MDNVISSETMEAMSKNLETPQATVADQPTEEVVKLSKHEKSAMEKGWRPKSEWTGDEEDYVDAKEFLARKELYDHIHKQSRQLKDTRKALEQLMIHNKKIEDVTYKKAIADLTQRQREAARAGDDVAVSDITKELVELQTQQLQAAQHDSVGVTLAQQAVQEFLDRNASWYNTNTPEFAAMKAYAELKDVEIKRSRPDLGPEDALALVEQEVKKAFPDKFKSRPVSAVSTGTTQTSAPATNNSSSISFDSIPKEHRNIIRTFQNMDPNFDWKRYVNHLKQTGEI